MNWALANITPYSSSIQGGVVMFLRMWVASSLLDIFSVTILYWLKIFMCHRMFMNWHSPCTCLVVQFWIVIKVTYNMLVQNKRCKSHCGHGNGHTGFSGLSLFWAATRKKYVHMAGQGSKFKHGKWMPTIRKSCRGQSPGTTSFMQVRSCQLHFSASDWL